MERRLGIFFAVLILAGFLPLSAPGLETGAPAGKTPQVSDHFGGSKFFNPGIEQPSDRTQPQRRSSWIWRWVFGTDWPAWPDGKDFAPGPAPAARVPQGTLLVTPVGHATFLVQMDGLNILTDPMWSERCSPISWAGPKRHRPPGIRFEDLPPIDAVLISHNHYDHLDLPTLARLAVKGAPRALVPFGDRELVRDAGIPTVDELDWWQQVHLSPNVTVTLVPAQHFSARTLWDRDQTLWGGFVVSGPSGNVYFAGDTGYGPHFREIARRFAPIRVALLPIAPFHPLQSREPSPSGHAAVHMGPAEAVQAHLDLGAGVSIAGHFRVFQFGPESIDDAVQALAATLRERNLKPDAFVAPIFGRAIGLTNGRAEAPGPVSRVMSEVGR